MRHEGCICIGQKRRLVECSVIGRESSVCVKPRVESSGFLVICKNFLGWLQTARFQEVEVILARCCLSYS